MGSPIPLFVRVSGDPRDPATRIANRVAAANPGVERRFIDSAAAALLTVGERPNDSRVLAEAQRRKRYRDEAVAKAMASMARTEERARAVRAERERREQEAVS